MTQDAREPEVDPLLARATTTSQVAWLRLPDGATHPFWFVSGGRDLLVVSGPGEQHLPWLAEHVEVLLRSKDTGGLLLRVAATAVEIRPGTADFEAAAQQLAGARLNAPGPASALTQRWAEHCTIHRLTPQDGPSERPDDHGGRVLVVTGAAASVVPRPWHAAGRSRARRNRRAQRRTGRSG